MKNYSPGILLLLMSLIFSFFISEWILKDNPKATFNSTISQTTESWHAFTPVFLVEQI
ncbi:MAG: hypothetical protein ABIG46_08520 [Candidatus Omnitrophota bacterium]